ncbi:MAG: hypothetical protein Q4C61_03340 [Lachnospiraceae bacterium]|nr:hypothetical protein [Lachnospiraceae bacterium]
MRLFFNTRNRRTGERFCRNKIDSSILVRIMDFAEKVEPLRRPSSLRVELTESRRLKAGADATGGNSKAGMDAAGPAPYCLLIFSGEEEHGFLNAGYAAGQIASYLHFLGITASILPGTAQWMSQGAAEGEKCAVAVAFGHADSLAPRGKTKEKLEHPCISREYRENWAEEVLDFAKRSYPACSGRVRMLCKKNCICLMPKTLSGRKTAVSELEAGIAAANIMAAAEELWIDVVPVDTGDPRCLIGLCRRKDRAGVMKEMRNTFSGGPRKPVLEAAGRVS